MFRIYKDIYQNIYQDPPPPPPAPPPPENDPPPLLEPPLLLPELLLVILEPTVLIILFTESIIDEGLNAPTGPVPEGAYHDGGAAASDAKCSA